MTGHEPAFYLIALIAGLYVATRFVVDFARVMQPRVLPAGPAPVSLSEQAIIEIMQTALRNREGVIQDAARQYADKRDAELLAHITMIAAAVEQLQKQMSACIANIKDIAVSLNDIAPVVAAAKSSVAEGVVTPEDVAAMSAVQSRKFFRPKPSDINGNKTSAPTANDGRFQATSAAERAAEIVEAMQADVAKATDVQFPPLPQPSAERHNRDLIG